eukprot:1138227-Pelagomonas_calceolata.AAC.5
MGRASALAPPMHNVPQDSLPEECTALLRLCSLPRVSSGNCGRTIGKMPNACFVQVWTQRGTNRCTHAQLVWYARSVTICRNEDSIMFETLGLRSRPAFMPYASGGESSRTFDSEAAAVEAMGGSGCKAPNEEAKRAPLNSQAMAAGVGAATEASAAAAAQAAASEGGCCGGGCKA